MFIYSSLWVQLACNCPKLLEQIVRNKVFKKSLPTNMLYVHFIMHFAWIICKNVFNKRHVFSIYSTQGCQGEQSIKRFGFCIALSPRPLTSIAPYSPRGPHAFYVILQYPPISSILYFRKSTEVSPCLFYHSLFLHKSFLPLFLSPWTRPS